MRSTVFFRQRPRRAVRQAFSLVELLVVIFIIAILIGLLVPAVNSARQTAFKSTSANNLRQLALALVQYNDNIGNLPHSQRDPNNPNLPRHGWGMYALPYIERQDLYDRIDFTKGWQTPENTPVTSIRVDTFLSPAAPDSDRLDDKPEATPFSGLVASSDYATVTHVAQALKDAGLIDEAGDGIMPKNKKSRLADIHDGLSHTILLIDSAGRPYQYIKGKRIGTPYDEGTGTTTSGTTTGSTAGTTTAGTTTSGSTTSGSTTSGSTTSGSTTSGSSSSSSTNSNVVRVNGGGWSRNANDISLEGFTLTTSNGTRTVTRTGPLAINVANGENVIPLGVSPNTAYYGSNGTGAIYSFHPGGVNAAFADGSVRFIGERTDIRVLAKLITRNGSEVVADGSY